ncbi:50S ribosome-binding GTPase [Candidatus Pacearchaeota archaeon]|nr:50S ribosome-binding GTPase [Candidatus Pacearchaeota archaeon]
MRVRYIFSSRRTGTIEGKNDHRKAFPKIAKEVVERSDLLLEILDARFIEKTRNSEIEAFITSMKKKVIFVLNKADLVNVKELKTLVDLTKLEPYIFISCHERSGIGRLRNLIKTEIGKMNLVRKGFVGVIGYPNTGKSTIINILIGRKSASTSAEAGHTKGIQKLKLSKNILILDTPGVIPDKEYAVSNNYLKRHAEIGIRTYDKVKDPDFIVNKIVQDYPNLLEEYYQIDAKGDCEILMEKLGRKRNTLKKGNQVDTDKVARAILKDWQDGKIYKSGSVKMFINGK